jgi:hypothetical protein
MSLFPSSHHVLSCRYSMTHTSSKYCTPSRPSPFLIENNSSTMPPYTTPHSGSPSQRRNIAIRKMIDNRPQSPCHSPITNSPAPVATPASTTLEIHCRTLAILNADCSSPCPSRDPITRDCNCRHPWTLLVVQYTTDALVFPPALAKFTLFESGYANHPVE